MLHLSKEFVPLIWCTHACSHNAYHVLIHSFYYYCREIGGIGTVIEIGIVIMAEIIVIGMGLLLDHRSIEVCFICSGPLNNYMSPVTICQICFVYSHFYFSNIMIPKDALAHETMVHLPDTLATEVPLLPDLTVSQVTGVEDVVLHQAVVGAEDAPAVETMDPPASPCLYAM